MTRRMDECMQCLFPFLSDILIFLLAARNYVDKAASIDSNLTYASSDTFILRADYTNVLEDSASGRDSVRIKSKKTFKEHIVM